MGNEATGVRYAALDGWRGVAALAVAIYHLPLAFPWAASPVYRNLELSVDFFFVLSGFVIAHAARDGLPAARDGWAFMARRFFRVWPLHVAVLAFFVALESAKWLAARKIALPLEGQPFTGSFAKEAILTNLVFLQAWGIHPGTTWNGPSWSISGEFACYLLFALATVLLPRKRDWLLAAAAVMCFALILGVSDDGIYVTHDYGVPRAIIGFACGALLYRAMPLIRFGGSIHEVSSLLALGLFLVFARADWTSMLSPVVFAYVIAAHAAERGAVSRVLLSSPVQWLGLMSYAVYMLHAFLYQLLRIGLKLMEKAGLAGLDRLLLPNRELIVIDKAWLLWATAAAAIIATLVGAAILHRLIEKPGITLGRRVAARLMAGSSEAATWQRARAALKPQSARG
jgi:peptidoglycan/LPS O-acetylase OafA/YrhL